MQTPDLISCYFNHHRDPHILRNAKDWIRRSLDSGCRVSFVEYQIGERPFELSDSEFPHAKIHHVRGPDRHVVWMKEALINYAVVRLPEDSKYTIWEDADVEHASRSWVSDTQHMLQTHRAGQTWNHVIDYDAEGGVMRNEWGHDVDRSFCAAIFAGDVASPAGHLLNGDPKEQYKKSEPTQGYCGSPAMGNVVHHNKVKDWRQHFGYSWAIRTEILRDIGGLIDWLILGSADYHMARAFAGLKPDLKYATPGYSRRLNEFHRLCDQHVRQHLGCVPGLLIAHYHGPKELRFYMSRGDIFNAAGFDPDRDVGRTADGLPYLLSDNRVLRDGTNRYFAKRKAV